MTALDLLIELRRQGINVQTDGVTLRLLLPKGMTLPPGTKKLLREKKQTLINLLLGQPTEETFYPGVTVKIYRAKEACLKTGTCLHLEDCDLFPLAWAWPYCRERVALTVIPGRKEVRSNAG